MSFAIAYHFEVISLLGSHMVWYRKASRRKSAALTPAQPPTSDWRDDAETKGRAAFETAVTEPGPTPEPLAWLREYPTATGKKESNEDGNEA